MNPKAFAKGLQKNGNMPGGAWQLLLPRAKARGLQNWRVC